MRSSRGRKIEACGASHHWARLLQSFGAGKVGRLFTMQARQRVIFEMGLLMEGKGRERVLVVREGAKSPAILGDFITRPDLVFVTHRVGFVVGI
jgi:hypothetical protein